MGSRRCCTSEIGVIFQDFVRYQFTVGENIGVGDIRHVDERGSLGRSRQPRKGWRIAIRPETSPNGYGTQLGRWFRERTGAVARPMAEGGPVAGVYAAGRRHLLVLDEPTAAMDAEAESQVFERVRALTEDQMAMLDQPPVFDRAHGGHDRSVGWPAR